MASSPPLSSIDFRKFQTQTHEQLAPLVVAVTNLQNQLAHQAQHHQQPTHHYAAGPSRPAPTRPDPNRLDPTRQELIPFSATDFLRPDGTLGHRRPPLPLSPICWSVAIRPIVCQISIACAMATPLTTDRSSSPPPQTTSPTSSSGRCTTPFLFPTTPPPADQPPVSDPR